jgi:hypothetical protein
MIVWQLINPLQQRRFASCSRSCDDVSTKTFWSENTVLARKWRAVASATVTANFGSALIYSVDLFRWGREWLANWAVFL